jgi:DNA ligase (NAD+)
LKLEYENGELVRGSTRGDGAIGEDVTHNLSAIAGIPKSLNRPATITVTGEAFIADDDFVQLKTSFKDSAGKEYKNARNMASGAVRNLDANKASQRGVRFKAFTSYLTNLDFAPECATRQETFRTLESYGFDVPEWSGVQEAAALEETIKVLKNSAKKHHIPIDGLVMSYDDLAFSKSLGTTGHHPKDSIAFKFEDEFFESVLREIEWNVARNGEIVPVAIFDPTDIDGTEVTRASLHNLTFIEKLKLHIGDEISVSKRNMIIPHIEANLTAHEEGTCLAFPEFCPCCGEKTHIASSNTCDTLFCRNADCSDQLLSKFEHFAARKSMNIEGLSGKTLHAFWERGFLKEYADIYKLDAHADEIKALPRFGEKKWERLWSAIQTSRNTTEQRFLIALDIPGVGKTASGELLAHFGNFDAFLKAVRENYDFTAIENFGDTINTNIREWFANTENQQIMTNLRAELVMNSAEKASTATADSISESNPFFGKNVVATGKLENFTREGIADKLTELGAKVQSSVTKTTDFLIAGEKAGSKLEKAESFGVKILSETEFLDMCEN